MRQEALPRPGPRRLAPLVPLLLGLIVAIAIGYLFRTTIWDFMQHEADAAYFFETASTGDYDFGFDERLLITENVLPLILYGGMYGLMSAVGLEANPFGGILVNAVLVVATIALALHYARTRFGFGPDRQLKLAAMLSFNGLVMMFAGIHMRDAFLLVTATAAVVAFHPSSGHTSLKRHAARFTGLVVLVMLSFLSRRESFAVPILVCLLGVAATLDFRRAGVFIKMLVLAAVIAAVAVQFDVAQLVARNADAYKRLSETESSSSSFGYYLLYELPAPVSTLAGMVLLLFIKVPFWRGALKDSYSFYMTLAALQMLFVAPALVGVAWFALMKRLELRFRYLLLILVAMLVVVAITSNQVRHFAIVYPMLMIVFLSRYEIVPRASRQVFRQFSLTMTALVILVSLVVGVR